MICAVIFLTTATWVPLDGRETWSWIFSSAAFSSEKECLTIKSSVPVAVQVAKKATIWMESSSGERRESKGAWAQVVRP